MFLRNILAGFLLTSLAMSGFAGTDQERVWVIFDSDVVTQLPSVRYGAVRSLRVVWNNQQDPVAIAQIDRGDLPWLSKYMHDVHRRCGGYTIHANLFEAMTVGEQLRAAERTLAKKRMDYTLTNAAEVAGLLAEVREDHIVSVIESLSGFDNRYYDSSEGVAAAHWLRDYWGNLTTGRADASVECVTHSGFPQPSVILTLTGTKFPDEVIVLGGHLDSTLSFGSSGRSPGADDDASGIACLTEVIRTIIAKDFRPERTVKFMGYAGEEHGLLGSRDIAADFRSRNVNMVGGLQLDMTNYKGSNEDFWLLTDFTNAAQNTFVASLIDTYLPDLTRSTTRCGYGCSDHASWYREGYPVSMPSESRFGEHNPNLHSSDDTIAISNGEAKHAIKFAKLATCFVAELAKGESQIPTASNQARVSSALMTEIINEYGNCDSQLCERDLDGNGVIDQADLLALLSDWPARRCLGFGSGPACSATN